MVGWLGRALLACSFVVLGLPAAMPAGAQEDAGETAADATVRVVNASPGSPDFDILLDGLPLAEGVAFGAATEYAPVAPGSHLLQAVPPGGSPDEAVAQADLDAAQAAAYLFVVTGPLAEAEGRLFDVALDDIAPGNARVRLVNASPGEEAIDLAVTGGDMIFDGIGFGDASDYADLAPATYSFDLRGDDDRVLATAPEVTIEEAAAYDIVALGGNDGPTLLALETRVSPTCGVVLGIGTGDEACVRLVHAAPSAPPVDVYVNDSLIGEGLEFGVATAYAPVPSGDGRAFRVAAAGTPVAEAIASADLALNAGQAYTVLVTGAEGDLQMLVTGTDLRPIPAGQARLGFIHASPDTGAVTIELADGPTLVTDLGFRAVSEYTAIDAGEYAVHVRQLDGEGLVALAADLTVDEGTVYDAVAIGRGDDDTLALLVLTAPAEVRSGAVATPAAPVSEGAAPAPATAVATASAEPTALADVEEPAGTPVP